MRSFLAVAAEKKQRSIVLLREKLETGRVFEWMNVILLRKPYTEWPFQGVDVGEKILDQGRTGCASKKKDRLGVFVSMRLFFRQCSF